MSIKAKNAKISTEAELVPVDDGMGCVLITRHSLAAHRQLVPTTTIYK